MKRLLLILTTGIIALGCTNKDIRFDDYSFQSIYFPFQTPVRTLVLGDETIGDNSIDLEHAFSIGVTMGGTYENNRDRVVTIAYAPELGENVTDGNGNALELLPEEYYQAGFNTLVIPEGAFSGKLRVDLTDEFFADSLSATTHYVIPVRITGVEGDSVLRGVPLDHVDNPDPRVAEDWKTTPKDYTLFGIKYINPTHGMYLLRGKRTNTTTGQEVTYSERFLTDNNMTKLTTVSLTENVMNIVGGTNSGGSYKILLEFNQENKTVEVSQEDASSVAVSGSGVYFSKEDPAAEGYNGNKHRTIYLDYSYQDAGETYEVQDSLVFVDTDVVFEEFKVIIADE